MCISLYKLYLNLILDCRYVNSKDILKTKWRKVITQQDEYWTAKQTLKKQMNNHKLRSMRCKVQLVKIHGIYRLSFNKVVFSSVITYLSICKVFMLQRFTFSTISSRLDHLSQLQRTVRCNDSMFQL